MVVFLNGKYVAAEKAFVSVSDRGFLYGDGLFDTMRVYQGRSFQWTQHWARFERGAAFLKIPLPFSEAESLEIAGTLLKKNAMSDAVLRLHLSRGVSGRGYSTRGVGHPTFVISVHDVPQKNPAKGARWNLVTSSFAIAKKDPLAAIKTSNKLVQILARQEAEERGADEALILNDAGQIAEGASANIFWVNDGKVYTPPLSSGALPGITRATVIEICRALKIPMVEKTVPPKKLRAEAFFLTSSVMEIVDVASLDGSRFKKNALTEKLRSAYRKLTMDGVR